MRSARHGNGGYAANRNPQSRQGRLIHSINWRPLGFPHGQTSRAIFSLGCQEARIYTRRKRREVVAWIKSVATQIVSAGAAALPVNAAQAWRVAAENWLQRNGVISIARRRNVLLGFQI